MNDKKMCNLEKQIELLLSEVSDIKELILNLALNIDTNISAIDTNNKKPKYGSIIFIINKENLTIKVFVNDDYQIFCTMHIDDFCLDNIIDLLESVGFIMVDMVDDTVPYDNIYALNDKKDKIIYYGYKTIGYCGKEPIFLDYLGNKFPFETNNFKLIENYSEDDEITNIDYLIELLKYFDVPAQKISK